MPRRYRHVSLGRPDRIRDWHSLGKRLRLKSMGYTLAAFPPGKGYDHPHSHALQEEVYVLLAGRGEMGIDGVIVPMKPGDVVAVDPPARRALRSSSRSPSTWLIVGAVPGAYRADDWTEHEEAPFPVKKRRTAKKRSSRAGSRAGRDRAPRRTRA